MSTDLDGNRIPVDCTPVAVVPGDLNTDQPVDISDAITALDLLFGAEFTGDCQSSCTPTP